jgi:glycerol-3-phosphate acyltransferase PlsY
LLAQREKGKLNKREWMSALDMIVSLVFGYLCGTIPFGLILTKSAGLGDIRSIGSGNIGATNVLRTGNKKVAALTLVLDALKGTVPALLMGWLFGPQAAVLAGLAAFFGHLFPMWLGFKGGKGVATSIGVLFGLFWPLGLIFITVWIVMAGLFRISSLSALTASLLSPVAAWGVGRSDLILPAAIMGVAVFITHRANIARILKGGEPRIGKSKPA